jgi:copper chaperone
LTDTFILTVTGMHCGSCGMLIDDTIEDLPGVRQSQTSVKAARTVVTADTATVTVDQLVAAIGEAGYRGLQGCSGQRLTPAGERRLRAAKRHRIRRTRDPDGQEIGPEPAGIHRPRCQPDRPAGTAGLKRCPTPTLINQPPLVGDRSGLDGGCCGPRIHVA